jgi:hypothetical protein
MIWSELPELTSINSFKIWVQTKPVAPVTKTFLSLFDIIAIVEYGSNLKVGDVIM